MPTPAGPFLVKINKKTGTNTYTLYYPQTDAQYVLYAPDVISDPDFTALTHYDKYGDAASGGAYLHVNDVLDVIFKALHNVSNVLEFKGVKEYYSDLGTASAATVGDVWVVNHEYETYPAGTLYVGATDGAETPTYSWEPLGGNNTIYATKEEAVGSISVTASGLQYTNVANTQTHSVGGAIGTTTIGTTAIATSISSGSSTAIPTEGAVYNFAASAGKLNTTDTPAGSTAVYFIAVTETAAGTGQQPIHTWISADISGNKPYLDINVEYASYAGAASKLLHDLSIGGITYNGADGKTVSFGDGLSTTTAAYSSTIAVKPASGGAVTVTANGVDLTKPNTITADEVYSAIQVDAYGRAKAGAQSVVWAKDLNQGELADLVIGGLAFISDNESQQANSTKSTDNLTVVN